MCLEFLCSWRHRDEDGYEHNLPQIQRPSSTGSSSPSHSMEHNNGTYYPANNEAPPQSHWERFNSTEDISKEENQLAGGVIVNSEKAAKDAHSKTTSMALNGEKVSKAVHPSPHVSVPQAGVSMPAAPVQQTNLKKGIIESNGFATNGYYPTVDDSGRTNPNMRKDEEDDQEEEEERAWKVAQTKNRWYS